jgi:hypothetical protein
MTSRLSSIIPVWIVVVIGAVLVAVFSKPSQDYVWLTMLLAVAILLSFVVQLAQPTTAGLVLRMTASVGGSVVLLAIATGAVVLLRL